MDRPLRAPGTQRSIATGIGSTRHLERRSCGPWIYVSDEPTYTYLGIWVDVSVRQRTRYRWLLGGGVEVQLHATGGAAGSPIFQLRPGYFDSDQDPVFAGSDSSGVFRPWHIDGTTGQIVDGI